MKPLLLYFIALLLFFLLDMLWLGWLARDFYQRQLFQWLSPDVNWTAAIIFYLLFIGGLTYFALWPAWLADSPAKSLIAGALYGLMTYATYEMTNKATLKDWPTVVVLVDMLWGMVLCTIVSGGAFTIGKWLLK